MEETEAPFDMRLYGTQAAPGQRTFVLTLFDEDGLVHQYAHATTKGMDERLEAYVRERWHRVAGQFSGYHGTVEVEGARARKLPDNPDDCNMVLAYFANATPDRYHAAEVRIDH